MPHRLTLLGMASEIRTGKLSPLELLDAHLNAIGRANPRINAFVRVRAEEARSEARVIEHALRKGDAVGPLAGVPVTIKDSFDVAGMPTLCGSRLRLGHVAAEDSTAVARLRAAGAVVLGKTNCPEFLGNYESDNHITGRSNNPWNVERTSGGSSGGEAAAIASFCSAGGIGSDGGGSIRVPAHFCGIAGLKPTPGRVSMAGHFPETLHPGGLLGVGGPMARTATDVAALFEALAGYDAADPFSAPVPVRRSKIPRNLRVGVMEQFGRAPVQPAIRQAVRKAARMLGEMGFDVDAFEPRGIERAPNVWSFFFGDLQAMFTRQFIAGREGDTHWTGTEFLELANQRPLPTAKDILDNLAARDHMRASLLAQMRDWPVLLLPVCGVEAFAHRQRRFETDAKPIGLFEAMMPVTPFNLLGMPGMVIPFDVAESGLPIGIQLVARPWEEELLLALAARLEEVRGEFPLPESRARAGVVS